GRGRDALPARPSRGGDHVRGHRRTAEPDPRPVGEPAPRAEGAARGDPRSRPVSSAMAADPYVGYRDALRSGHLAALRGAHEPAIRAYREAARLLPDRAAAYVALGRTQLAVGRPEEALASFEAALSRAPRNTAALDGAARALLELERANDAADVLDGLAAVYAKGDRPADALATVERATEISGSPWRRAMLEQLHGEEPQPAMALPWLADPDAGARPRVAGRAVTDELRDISERVEV